jgi:glutathione synthase/RimK-type ligase-like ATP-grasp enzyme
MRTRSCNLDDISAAYIRPYDSRQLLTQRQSAQRGGVCHHAQALDSALSTWVELTQARVVNRLSAMGGNSSKPYQAAQIQSEGFDIPESVITTDPEVALAFWEQHGVVIYKSVSSVRSIVARLTLTHRSRLKDIRWCPTQFQQFITGTDVRVHVVGEQTFACEIISAVDDYRYAGRQGASVEIRPCDLPQDCQERCVNLAQRMGLFLAGIDLRRTPEGRWYCFEVNPSPGFTYYQEYTQHPIDSAIAQLLIGSSPGPSAPCC